MEYPQPNAAGYASTKMDCATFDPTYAGNISPKTPVKKPNFGAV